MKNYIVKNTVTGLFYASGTGFTAKCQNEATKYNDELAVSDVIDCAGAMGITAESVVEVEADANIVQNPDGTSFAVMFIRNKDIVGGAVKQNKRNPSVRRFRTKDEANHHGARFVKIEKHAGFYVVQTNDPVNAYVNKVTGFTNPEIGKKRLGGTR